MKEWLAYFQKNRVQRLEILWDIPLCFDSRTRSALVHSFQRFQVGESGEGNHLRTQARTVADPAYHECIDLFIKEEQEHARLFAELLRRLNAPLLKRHWSDSCFVLLRRLFQLKEELLVLLVPEMIAQVYFQFVHDGTANPVLRAVFRQMLNDEHGHVAFHIAFLHKELTRESLLKKVLVRTVWRAVFRLACVVVMFDHRAAMRAVGVSPMRFWWDSGLKFDQVAAEILGSVPAYSREACPA